MGQATDNLIDEVLKEIVAKDLVAGNKSCILSTIMEISKENIEARAQALELPVRLLRITKAYSTEKGGPSGPIYGYFFVHKDNEAAGPFKGID